VAVLRSSGVDFSLTAGSLRGAVCLGCGEAAGLGWPGDESGYSLRPLSPPHPPLLLASGNVIVRLG
jgi:hypothetical protein